MLSPVLMRSFSQDMAVIIFILSSIADKESEKSTADKARPFPTQTHPASTKTSNGSSSLYMCVCSRAAMSSSSKSELKQGMSDYQTDIKHNLSVIMKCLGLVC